MALNGTPLARRGPPPRTRLPASTVVDDDDDDDIESSDLERDARLLLDRFTQRKVVPTQTKLPSSINGVKRKAETLLKKEDIPPSSATSYITRPDDYSSDDQSFYSAAENDTLPSSWTTNSNNTSSYHDVLPKATSHNNTLKPGVSATQKHTISGQFARSSSLDLVSPGWQSSPISQAGPGTPSASQKRPRGRPPRHSENFKMASRPGRSRPRRSARSTAQPANYFAPIPGFTGYDYDLGDLDDASPSSGPIVDNTIIEPLQLQPRLPSLARKRMADAPQPRLLYRFYNSYVVREILEDNLESAFSSNDQTVYRPYIVMGKRKMKAQSFSPADIPSNGTIFHVDFTIHEMKAIYTIIVGRSPPNDETPIQDQLFHDTRFFGTDSQTLNSDSVVKRIRRLRDLKRLLPTEFRLNALFGPDKCLNYQRIVKQLAKLLGYPAHHHDFEECEKFVETTSRSTLSSILGECDLFKELKQRSPSDISAFISDTLTKSLSSVPSLLKIYPSTGTSSLTPSIRFDESTPSALIRSRQLGYSRHNGSNYADRKLRDILSRKWELTKSWRGASRDVLNLAWAPDGTQFIAGASTYCDTHNREYNNKNNLLLGDLCMGSITEIPDHRLVLPLEDQISSHLYMTISAVHWSDDQLFTASYDKTVKIWQTNPELKCAHTLTHSEKVEVMSISRSSLVASGCQDNKPIKIWSLVNDTYHCLPLKSFPNFSPHSLAWGSNPSCCDFLVAGLFRNAPRSLTSTSTSTSPGSLVLWQVDRGSVHLYGEWEMSQPAFDIKWHPSEPIFMAGCSTPSTRSLLRFYDPLRSDYEVASLKCPALDINEVTFCPSNDNYITASCTDNLTYVWDRRKPNEILHQLGHGRSLDQAAETSTPQEESDCGVRFAAWDTNSNFYTGGSDGVVKLWDVRCSPNDLTVDDIATFNRGVMSGALSPDNTNMIIGDAGGAVHVLTTAPFNLDDGLGLTYKESVDTVEEETDVTIEETKKQFESGELSMHFLYGPGKGPNYKGPFAAWARPPGTLPEDMASTNLLPIVQAQQLYLPSIHLREILDEDTKKHVQHQITLAKVLNERTAPLVETPSPPQSPSNQAIEISSDEDDVISYRDSPQLSIRSRRRPSEMSLTPSPSKIRRHAEP